MTLKELQIGKSAVVDTVGGSGALRQHFLDMGLIPGAEVTLVKLAPMGDPMELRIHGYELTLRLDDAAQIGITPTEKAPAISAAPADDRMVDHPGLGEGGKYHIKKGENPLPEGRTLTFALAGNQNCGKTTLFNQLTGSNQHVGNFPGVTVDRKSGAIKGHPETEVTDLPGIYSMSPYSSEEIVTRQFIIGEKPTGIINIVDATNIERNLYLTMQLMELDTPMVLALNMMDEAAKQGMTIDIERLSQRLGFPVMATVARTGEGLPELLKATEAYIETKRGEPWEPLHISYGPDLDPVLRDMEAAIAEAGLLASEYPARWVALKLLEQDEEILTRSRAEAPELAADLERQVDEVARHLRDTLNTWPEAVIADYRYGFISSLLRDGVLVRLQDMHARIQFSDRMDKVLTHPFMGPAIMLGVLYLLYTVTFTIGEIPMGWVEQGFALLREGADAVLPDGQLKSLVLSGIIDGVGGVMSFVPLIMLIFLQIAFLEDTGYMARMAYMLDRIFRIFGLHGCSVMPFIVGGGIAGGCAVPGVLAARTLRSPREKIATLLTVPFMACGAKLPVFILFSGVFFPGHEAAVMFGLTLTGWVVALLTARLLRSTIIRGPSTPFVMELPPYRLPTMLGLAIHTGERTFEYLKKAGTVILAISIILWAAMAYPQLPLDTRAHFAGAQQTIEANLEAAKASGGDVAALEEQLTALHGERAERALQHSFAGRLGMALEPLTRPAGFDWRTDIALVGGFAAKEVIVATLGTAYSLGDIDPEDPTPLAQQIRNDGRWTPATALALLVFVLLYAPCLVTVAAIRQETGSWGWPVFSMVFNTLIAFGAAVAVRHVTMLFL